MIIHQPEITVQKDELCLSARVETHTPVPGLPERLWFKVPEEYHSQITDRSDSFAACLLVLAMFLGEDLRVRGVVSPRLAYGLQEWQQAFHLWYPKILKPVNITFDKLHVLPSEEVLGKVGMAFSGGADSLYTLWSHIPQNQPLLSAQVTHGVFIHGIDLRLYEEELYRSLFQRYSEVYRDLGLHLLSIRTNAFLFFEFRLDWGIAHGGTILGTPLVFSKLFKRFYIASSLPYNKLSENGTSPVTDHLLSTETMEFIHHGSAKFRIQKLGAMKDWPAAHSMLRVCTNYAARQGYMNCCRCEKCIRNMTMLNLLGVSSKFKTFHEPYRFRDYLRLITMLQAAPLADRQIYKAALTARRWEIVLAAPLIIQLDHLKSNLHYTLIERTPRKLLYRIKSRIYHKRADLRQSGDDNKL